MAVFKTAYSTTSIYLFGPKSSMLYAVCETYEICSMPKITGWFSKDHQYAQEQSTSPATSHNATRQAITASLWLSNLGKNGGPDDHQEEFRQFAEITFIFKREGKVQRTHDRLIRQNKLAALHKSVSALTLAAIIALLH